MPPLPPIAIIGSGPIALEAALYARTLNHPVKLFERSDLAANVAAWHFVRLFSPWPMNTTPLGLRTLHLSPADLPPDHCPTGQEFRDRYLLPLAHSPLLKDCIHTHTRVLAVGKEDFHKSDAIGKPARAASPFRLLVAGADGRERIERASIVLDCSGTYTNPRHAGLGGIPAPGESALRHRIRYTLPDLLGQDAPSFAGKHTLVLGAGYSAATAISALQHLHRLNRNTRVTWAIRRPGPALHDLPHDPLPQRAHLVSSMLQLTQNPPDWLRFLDHAAVESIDDDDSTSNNQFHITLRAANTAHAVSCDHLLSLVGFAPDASLYEQLQVHQCYATSGPIKLAAALLGASNASSDCLTAGSALTPDTLKNPEPHFFILGAKSFGTSSHFLLQTGHRQIRDTFRLLHNHPTLDLYATPG